MQGVLIVGFFLGALASVATALAILTARLTAQNDVATVRADRRAMFQVVAASASRNLRR